eukprot:2653768-Pyramimonas_sp.AAC.1
MQGLEESLRRVAARRGRDVCILLGVHICVPLLNPEHHHEHLRGEGCQNGRARHEQPDPRDEAEASRRL